MPINTERACERCAKQFGHESIRDVLPAEIEGVCLDCLGVRGKEQLVLFLKDLARRTG